MAAMQHGGPGPDLYQLLGVAREASREEIAQAWRRRARGEHPDACPADAGAPGRFRALAEAWEVLGDSERRAVYDRALARERPLAVPVTVRRPSGPGGMSGTAPLRIPEPPLRAGPVRVEGVGPAPSADGWDEEDVGLVLLAELALQYLAWGRGRSW